MGYSSLVSLVQFSPNIRGKANHKRDSVVIHCMAGNMSIESCGNLFAKSSTKASANYGVGSDGRIACYVDESNAALATSSASVDHRAISIEVANDGGANTGWHVSDKALDSLILLLVDICKRNGIPKLLWKADKNLIGQIDKQNMLVHRWFANKACPGDYIYNKHFEIAKRVNAILFEAYTKEDDDMFDINNLTEQQLYDLSARINAVLSAKPESNWSKVEGSFAKAKDKGVMDGSSPLTYVTREQLAAVLSRLGLLEK